MGESQTVNIQSNLFINGPAKGGAAITCKDEFRGCGVSAPYTKLNCSMR